jgi:O-antigen/teichoic acid export membrane protein
MISANLSHNGIIMSIVNIVVKKLKKGFHYGTNSDLLLKFAWSFQTNIYPLIAALAAMPILHENIGTEKLGIVSLTWVLVGYFTLLDLGVGKALTYSVSSALGEKSKINDLTQTAISFLLIVSIIFSAIGYMLSSTIVSLLNTSSKLQLEVENGVQILFIGMPFVILSLGFRGIVEGFGDFKQVALINIPGGIALFVFPAIASYATSRLDLLLLSIVSVRFLICLNYIWLFKKKSIVELGLAWRKDDLKELLTFGGWLSITNTVSPLMTNMDRFFIAARMKAELVAFYTVPFDFISKSVVVSSAFGRVIFPKLTNLLSSGESAKAKSFTYQYMLVLAVIYAFGLSFIYVYAEIFLTLWIGEEFSQKSFEVLKVLCIGVFFNAVAYMPFNFIQSAGRSDLTAKVHLAEVVVYVPVVITLIDSYGILGAALSWSFRTFGDFVIMLFIMRRI